jgi:hypothetical protein
MNFDAKKTKTSVAENKQISSGSDSDDGENYSSDSNDDEDDDHSTNFQPPAAGAQFINHRDQAVENDVLEPVELGSDLIGSNIEFSNQSQNVMQVYQSNDCGDIFLPSFADGFIYSFPYENIQQYFLVLFPRARKMSRGKSIWILFFPYNYTSM